MHASTIRITLLVTTLAFAAPASTEPSWLTKWKTFLDEHVLVDKNADEQQAATPETSRAEETQKTTPAPILQPGDPGDFKLSGKWVLSARDTGGELGSLDAGSKYFTLKLTDPKVELRTAYMQTVNGGFRCTVLDKKVVTMEGHFENKDRIDFQMQVKEIGHPAIKHYRLVAKREG